MFLFLDDERNPQDVTWLNMPKGQYEVVRNGEEFLTMLQRSSFDVIFLDHDLALPDFDGYEAVKLLVDLMFRDHFDKLPQVVVHSKNPVGAKNMKALWANAKKEYKDAIADF